jgi:hypothetical protein
MDLLCTGDWLNLFQSMRAKAMKRTNIIYCSRPSSTKPPWQHACTQNPMNVNAVRLSFVSLHIYQRIAKNCINIHLPSFSKLVDPFTLAKQSILLYMSITPFAAGG